MQTEGAFSTAMYNKRFIFPSSPVHLSPFQSTCTVLARFIKLLLQAFLFHYLVSEKQSLYGVFTHVPTNLLAFNILTVLSMN